MWRRTRCATRSHLGRKNWPHWAVRESGPKVAAILSVVEILGHATGCAGQRLSARHPAAGMNQRKLSEVARAHPSQMERCSRLDLGWPYARTLTLEMTCHASPTDKACGTKTCAKTVKPFKASPCGHGATLQWSSPSPTHYGAMY